MNDTSAMDLTKPLVGMTPFPPANEVFDQNEVFLVEHLHPLFSIDASIIDPAWSGQLHMLSPIESSEGLPGDLSAELGVHNPMLTTNWIGFRVEDGLYKLCGSPRYFFLHPENSQVPEPLPGARAALQQHYEAQHASYNRSKDWYLKHGTIAKIDWDSTKPVGFVGQLGGVANGDHNWVTAVEYPVHIEQREGGFHAAFPISPRGRRFQHVASVQGQNYRQYGADTILMFYEPVEKLVLFTFDF